MHRAAEDLVADAHVRRAGARAASSPPRRVPADDLEEQAARIELPSRPRWWARARGSEFKGCCRTSGSSETMYAHRPGGAGARPQLLEQDDSLLVFEQDHSRLLLDGHWVCQS